MAYMNAVEMIDTSAMFSECGNYRYWLKRLWDESLPQCAFIMLNPSTADAEKNDPTIRRVISFCRAEGFGGVNVYNLFALRSTDPKALLPHPDPVGPDNDIWINQIPDGATIVAAWGAAHKRLSGRAFDVRRRFAGRLSCLGKTKSDRPRHPLYVKASQRFEPYGFLGEW